MSPKTCPFCGVANSYVKHGKTSQGKQRYRCKLCNKTFISNQSPTKSLTSISTFKKFIGFMIDDVSLEVIARNLSINVKTAHYYRFIVFKCLENYQNTIILNGTLFIDETYIPINVNGLSFQTSDGKKIRGLSKNQLGIITIINSEGICVAKAVSRATPQPEQYFSYFKHNIGKVDLFYHDGNTKQFSFVRSFTNNLINVTKLRKEGIDAFLFQADSLHNLLKRHLIKHSGYSLFHIHNYLNFFVFRNNYIRNAKPKNTTKRIQIKNEMIRFLYQLIRKSMKTITYRTFLNDKKPMNDILK